jgi:phenylacetate-CoA ligase
MRTSGSTGERLTIAQDWKCRETLGGLAPRIFDGIKIGPVERTVQIYKAEAGERQRKTSRFSGTRLAAMYNHARYDSYLLGLRTRSLFFEDPNELANDVLRLVPSLIIGNPSYLREMVKCFRRNPRGLKAVYSTADPLSESDRSFLMSAFDCPVYDVYGAREVGIVSWQCSDCTPGLMHLNVETAVLELVAGGEGGAASGEVGDIVLTTLYNRAMPLIRYRIGDKSLPTDERCSCGRGLPLLRSVERASPVTPDTVMDGRT